MLYLQVDYESTQDSGHTTHLVIVESNYHCYPYSTASDKQSYYRLQWPQLWIQLYLTNKVSTSAIESQTHQTCTFWCNNEGFTCQCSHHQLLENMAGYWEW